MNKIKTESDYLWFVENYIFLLEEELFKIEKLFDEWEKVASKLPLLISLVNTVEAFRWQNNLFTDFRERLEREDNTGIQAKLREFEKEYIERLDNLIEKVIKKENLKKDFEFQYFWRLYLDRWLKKYLNYRILNKNKFINLKNISIFLIILIILWIKIYFVMYN